MALQVQVGGYKFAMASNSQIHALFKFSKPVMRMGLCMRVLIKSREANIVDKKNGSQPVCTCQTAPYFLWKDAGRCINDCARECIMAVIE